MRKQEANSLQPKRMLCVRTFTSAEIHSLASGINLAQDSFCSEGKYSFYFIMS